MARHVKSDLALAPSAGHRSGGEHPTKQSYIWTFYKILQIVSAIAGEPGGRSAIFAGRSVGVPDKFPDSVEQAAEAYYNARSMTPAVGADIESICRKCGDVWHVVVAKPRTCKPPN